MFAPLFVYSYLTASFATAKRSHNERGASFTEYVVLLAGIIAVVAAGVLLLKGKIEGVINGVEWPAAPAA